MALLRRPAVTIHVLTLQEFPTITFNKHESIEMPFRKCPFTSVDVRCPINRPGYIADDKGEPILPPGMKEHLKADLDRTIEDF